MRVTMLDRWLFLGAMVSFLAVGNPGLIFGQANPIGGGGAGANLCDQKCRLVNQYWNPAINSCRSYQEPDCRPCDFVFNGNCRGVNWPGFGQCVGSATVQSVAPVTGCGQACPSLGDLAEAGNGIVGAYVMNGNAFECW